MCAMVYTPEHGWILNSSICLNWYVSICAKLCYWQKIGTHEKNNNKIHRENLENTTKATNKQPRATKKNKRKSACDCDCGESERIDDDDADDDDSDYIGICASSTYLYWCTKSVPLYAYVTSIYRRSYPLSSFVHFTTYTILYIMYIAHKHTYTDIIKAAVA